MYKSYFAYVTLNFTFNNTMWGKKNCTVLFFRTSSITTIFGTHILQ